MVDLTVLAAVVFAFGLVSRRLEGTVLTAPLLFVVAEEIEAVVALTVLLSVLLHGASAAPLSAAYTRRVRKMVPDAPEKREALGAPTRVGWVPASKPTGGGEV